MSPAEAPRRWRRGTLQDLVFLQRGFDITKEQQTPGPFPVISSSGVTSYHTEFKASGPGVVIGRKGTLGSVHYSETDYWPHDTTLWSKDLRGNNPLFVYFYLQTIDFKRFDVGNSNPTLNRNHIHDLPILIPPVDVQGRIAETLGAYRNSIENNRRRMALLEEAALQLYREWFVRLRFPGREHTRIVNGVPIGWERRPISDLTVLLKRGITPIYDDDAEGLVLNQKCVRNGRLDVAFARRQSREFKPDLQVKVGDVLVNSTGEGTLGRVAQVLASRPNCTVDTHVTIVRGKPDVELHYFGLAVRDWEPRFATMGRGATNQTELSPSQIGRAELLLAPRQLRQQFEEFATPIFRQIVTLTEQDNNLKSARDLLLPRLMKGEIVV